ncbi:sodium:calcium antiporter [Halobacillus litoralis]|uniref:sodium:calcium antiporter n=1 Tax=Halobacillus litoralis TaxID=45668 RepID=UPI001CD3CFEA|nr:sodium:calcium antiporter [Halobacillus litoralis]MCA0970693.1 sodium:calcium antiporter [Halobacillus litoralis]
MIYIIFFLAAALVVSAAVFLSQAGDVISRKSSLSDAVVGTFLIAGATSLPELTTSLTAIYIDNPDLAVGNMLGSNVFNLLILAMVDVVYRKHRFYQRINPKESIPPALVGLCFLLIILLALLSPVSIPFSGIGIEMFIIVMLYIVYIRYMTNREQEEEELPAKDMSLGGAVTLFSVAAIVVFLSGSILSLAGDRITEVSGLDSSFIGGFLIAVSTSLPELVTVLAAFKLANYNMAIGSILGSNLFNINLLVLTDILYRKGPILESIQENHLYIVLLGVSMTLFVIYLLLRRVHLHHRSSGQWRYMLPSLMMIVMYLVISYFLFQA